MIKIVEARKLHYFVRSKGPYIVYYKDDVNLDNKNIEFNMKKMENSYPSINILEINWRDHLNYLCGTRAEYKNYVFLFRYGVYKRWENPSFETLKEIFVTGLEYQIENNRKNTDEKLKKTKYIKPYRMKSKISGRKLSVLNDDDKIYQSECLNINYKGSNKDMTQSFFCDKNIHLFKNRLENKKVSQFNFKSEYNNLALDLSKNKLNHTHSSRIINTQLPNVEQFSPIDLTTYNNGNYSNNIQNYKIYANSVPVIRYNPFHSKK